MSVQSSLLRLGTFVGAIEKLFMLLAALATGAIMVIVSLDTVLRYSFHAPLTWSIDIVSHYLMVALFYLAVSYAFEKGDHIRMLAFRRLVGARVMAFIDAVIYACVAFIFATIGTRMFATMLHQWQAGESFIGVYRYPSWITSAPLALGCLLLVARLAVRTLQRLLDIASGKEDTGLEAEDIEELPA